MYATEELGAFVARHIEGNLPDRTREMMTLLVIDLLAASAAGFDGPLATAARSAAKDIFGAGPAGVWLTDDKLSIAGAAMANAAAASALDIDDGHRGAAGHPGAGIIPAAFAVGQALGSSDTAILDAIALGYDVALRVATARPVPTIITYASGRWLSFGVAAAAGRLLGLSGHEIAHAMAIASMEGPLGLVFGGSKYQGSTVKESIPPAVVSGLTGAFRARAGATGPIDLLDNEDFYIRSVLTDGLGAHWWLEDCYLKPYACCRYMHAAVDAILAMREPGKPIKSLRIETFARGLHLSNSRAPTTLEGGQYSYYFSCALAAVHGAAALQPVDPASLRDPAVLELAGRIELASHEDFDSLFPRATPCRVSLDQGSGPRVMTVPAPLGDVGNPISHAQVTEKFRRISASTLLPDAQDRILAAATGLHSTGFAALFDALVAPSPSKPTDAN
jgi:2-methylcitrate dehydratase PrpD